MMQGAASETFSDVVIVRTDGNHVLLKICLQCELGARHDSAAGTKLTKADAGMCGSNIAGTVDTAAVDTAG